MRLATLAPGEFWLAGPRSMTHDSTSAVVQRDRAQSVCLGVRAPDGGRGGGPSGETAHAASRRCARPLSSGEPITYPGGMEYFFACPYCSAQISMVLDTSVNGQIYVEDCEVCCRPIEVRYTAQDGEVNDFEARTLE